MFKYIDQSFVCATQYHMEAAISRIHALDQNSKAKITLNAMLNFEGEEARFQQVRESTARLINQTNTDAELISLAQLIDYDFLAVFLARGGSRPNSAPSSRPLSPIQESSSATRKISVREQVKKRDKNCVLTGNLSELGFELQVAHIVPFSIASKVELHPFIQSIIPWLPEHFFSEIDTPMNAILLEFYAHRYLGMFSWYIQIEDDEPLTKYRVLDLKEGQLLSLRPLLRSTDTGYVSAYGCELYIGQEGIQPSELYIKVHELIARILHARGGVEDLIPEEEDEEESFIVYDSNEKVRNFLKTLSADTFVNETV